MNPAIPLLIALILPGFYFLRHELGRGWLIIGMSAMLFLSPALLEPDGIPSPGEYLFAVSPWQQSTETTRINGILNDVIFQIQPWLVFLRSQVRAGDLPFWNPHQFIGAPFWSNGQSAPLFPLHLLFVVLPLQLGFMLLPWARIFIGGMGAYLLARELGVSKSGALIPGIVFPLSGMVSSFLLFPMGNALCLVPWILRSVERLAAGRGHWTSLTVWIALQALAGHPGTLIHTVMLSSGFLLLRGDLGLPSIWRFSAACLVAIAISSIQLVPLAIYLTGSSRWQMSESGQPVPFGLLAQLPLRLLLPNHYGHPEDGSWWGPFNYLATAVFVGVIPLLLAWIGIRSRTRERRWAALAALLLLSALAVYVLPAFPGWMQALPWVGKVPPHRLLFAVDLILALFAGVGYDVLQKDRRNVLWWGLPLLLSLHALCWYLYFPEWKNHNIVTEQAGWTCWTVLSGIFLVFLFPRVRNHPRSRWVQMAPYMTAILILAELAAAHARGTPVVSLNRFYPVTPAIEFLQGKTGRISGTGATLRPNAAMVYGLDDIRGDDTIKPVQYDRFYSDFADDNPTYFRPMHRLDADSLDRVGLRWIITGPEQEAMNPEWRLVYEGPDARIYERPSALPLIRWMDGKTSGPDAKRTKAGTWEISWSCKEPDTILIAESWDPGWRAVSDTQEYKVERVDGLIMGVRIGPGSGSLTLRYRPAGWFWGVALSLCGITVLVIFRKRKNIA